MSIDVIGDKPCERLKMFDLRTQFTLNVSQIDLDRNFLITTNQLAINYYILINNYQI